MHKLYKINDSIYPYRFIFYFITFIVFTPQILSYTLTSKFKTYYKAYYRLTTLHIHQLPHHNLLRTSNNIIHLPYPQHLIFCLQLFLHTLFLLHLFHKPIHHLIAFLINIMQIFIQLSFKQQLHIISMFELFQILTSHMSKLSDIIICSLWQL